MSDRSPADPTTSSQELWVATANSKKLVELERLLASHGYRVRSLADLEDGGPDIIEDGETFADNAAIKARTLAKITGAAAIGDDSGLCVDALGGAPGVRSARYAGPGATDTDRIDKLLRELDGVEDSDRSAHFMCCICLADASGQILATFEGRCDGVIATAPQGDGGFGYDPVFLPSDPVSLSGVGDPSERPAFAQLSPQDKDAISHRGRALRALTEHLKQRSNL